MNKEYVLWGKPPKSKEQTLLMATHLNQPITDKTIAEKLLKILTEKHGCTDIRIQVIDFNTNPTDLFVKAINQ